MKKSVISLVLATVCIPALPAEPSDRLLGCADIKDSRDRLACFDREVAPRARSSAPAAAPAVPAPAPAAAPAPAKPSFGEEQLQPKARKEAPAEEQALHARIERIRTVTSSDFIVYLDNGQAWRHQDVVQGGYLREGEAITISKAALGSYRLTRDAGSSKNWIRVTRFR